MPNLCVDCKHYRPYKNVAHSDLSSCVRPHSLTGAPSNRFAEIDREFDNPGNCGSNGIYFEPINKVSRPKGCFARLIDLILGR